MTETSSIVTSNGGIDYVNKPNSCGPAVPICDIRVVDERGHDVRAGIGRRVVGERARTSSRNI